MRSTALWLCLLHLLLFAVHLGSAAVLKNRADKSDLSKKCPKGTYLANDSHCAPCKEDKYTEYPNDFPKCLSCRTCREDQVELSPCINTRNTQCACKNGTFCLPDQPCEMCQKCQTQCPKGEVRIAPCTQHSDLKCGPPLDISSSFPVSIVIITVLLAVFLGFLLVALWRCYCNNHGAGDSGELSRKPSAVVVSCARLCSACSRLCLQLMGKLWWEERGGRVSCNPHLEDEGLQLGCSAFLSQQNRLLRQLGIWDNSFNEQIHQQQQQLLPAVQGSEVPRAVELEKMPPRTSNPNVEAWRKLVPVPGEDPIVLLRRSFNTFVNCVPFPEWKMFGRALDLTENDIYLAEQHDRCSREPFIQMLNTWLNRQGSNASVNTLLETLPRIGLGGVADKVASELVKEGYFQYRVS
ncbi:LOW QUALITY PROTEIN: tumor necrosis factor receptor superfamily member 10A-like [Cyrtonyx montezumae]|uniref:LOW QUALITY PROTEIN: tumor necrosis factor receptor superfamily member 10A-like n=1 Tax=Cyrtonyx montezumae TaxID=9017 RepID=UPI0032DA3F24